MIVYIVTDSPKNARTPVFYNIKCILEDVAGDVCLILRYDQVSLDLLERVRPWAVCHSGGSATYDEYDVLRHPEYQNVIHRWAGAQIGFCGGHQILAAAFGSTLGHMRALREGEPDLSSGYHAGYYKEWGMYPVRIVRRGPLFEGFGEFLKVQENHMDEVKELSADLILLASTTDCRVQAFVHRQKPIYGVQFHPEAASDTYPDGLGVLRNFFRLARKCAGVPATP